MLATKFVFFGCKKIDNKLKKKEAKKRIHTSSPSCLSSSLLLFSFVVYLLVPKEFFCRKRSCIISLFFVVLVSGISPDLFYSTKLLIYFHRLSRAGTAYSPMQLNLSVALIDLKVFCNTQQLQRNALT